MKGIYLGVLVVAFMPIVAEAQQNPTQSPETNPVSNAVRRSLERASKNLTAAAEAMPADKYGYKPTPEQMTFGHLVLHVVGTNNFLCSKISGSAAPEADKVSDTDGKDKLVAALKASFDYCTQALAKLDDSNLGEQLPFFGGNNASRAGEMMTLASSFADHYGTAAMYLRLNGVTPPTAQPKKE